MPPLPDVGPGQYLVDAFQVMGFAHYGFEGMAPQTWAEIDAFARSSQRISAGWEAELLRAMSVAYVNENQKASDPLRIAPMERPTDA